MTDVCSVLYFNSPFYVTVLFLILVHLPIIVATLGRTTSSRGNAQDVQYDFPEVTFLRCAQPLPALRLATLLLIPFFLLFSHILHDQRFSETCTFLLLSLKGECFIAWQLVVLLPAHSGFVNPCSLFAATQ